MSDPRQFRVTLSTPMHATEVVAFAISDEDPRGLCIAIHTGAAMVHLRPTAQEMRSLISALQMALGDAQ
jgi:hypothetical protein